MLRRIGLRAGELNDGEDEHGDVVRRKSINELLTPIKEAVQMERLGEAEPVVLDPGLFSCFHVVQTPTSLYLSGPHGSSFLSCSTRLSLAYADLHIVLLTVERSNRIIRQHLEHQTHFLRVIFR